MNALIIAVLSYDPDSCFSISALFKLEAAGVPVVTLLARNLPQFVKACGVALNTKKSEGSVVAALKQWNTESHPQPRTWRSLFEVLNKVDLGNLSHQIEEYLTGELKGGINLLHNTSFLKNYNFAPLFPINLVKDSKCSPCNKLSSCTVAGVSPVLSLKEQCMSVITSALLQRSSLEPDRLQDTLPHYVPARDRHHIIQYLKMITEVPCAPF
jgi:hypothetical protein